MPNDEIIVIKPGGQQVISSRSASETVEALRATADAIEAGEIVVGDATEAEDDRS